MVHESINEMLSALDKSLLESRTKIRRDLNVEFPDKNARVNYLAKKLKKSPQEIILDYRQAINDYFSACLDDASEFFRPKRISSATVRYYW